MQRRKSFSLYYDRFDKKQSMSCVVRMLDLLTLCRKQRQCKRVVELWKTLWVNVCGSNESTRAEFFIEALSNWFSSRGVLPPSRRGSLGLVIKVLIRLTCMQSMVLVSNCCTSQCDQTVIRCGLYRRASSPCQESLTASLGIQRSRPVL